MNEFAVFQDEHPVSDVERKTENLFRHNDRQATLIANAAQCPGHFTDNRGLDTFRWFVEQ